ncbi:MAG: response regulator [Gemmatimonadales bacterium]|nr:MAG: response regulator [Gemmatimonadales bacterium]
MVFRRDEAPMTPRVLVVNDDPVQLHWISETLRVHGNRVTAFLRSLDAVEFLHGAEPPDLVVADLHMPQLDGWKLCRLLRGEEFPQLADTPILVVSATFSGADAEQVSKSLGANGFLPLPCAADRLLREVGELLGDGRARDLPLLLLAAMADREADGAAPPLVSGELSGYHLEAPSNGETVLDALDRLAPAVVVLVSGPRLEPVVATLESIKDRFDPPVVLVARDPAVAGSLELLRAGADALLPLPLHAGELGELVARARRERALLRVEDVLEARTRELRISERKIRGLMACVPDGILALDRHLRVTEFNSAARLLLPGCELPGFRLGDVVHPEDMEALEEGIGMAVHGTMSGVEVRVPGRRPGSDEACDRILEVRGAPHGAGPGEDVLLLFRDVTEERREAERQRAIERRLEHTQRLESLGVMAGGIAHDFNNLLVAILGYAGLARMNAPPHSDLEEYLWQVETAARRASDLTEQILTFSGAAPVALMSVDLGALVREMTGLLRPALPSRAALVIEGDAAPAPILGDASQLRQVLMNLVMNGAEALEGEGGRVTVRVRAALPGEADSVRTIHGRSDGAESMVCLEVEDEGAGMEAATLDRIFEPFFTTKTDGRGLGLAAMAGIVRAHSGSIAVESSPGEGTRFRVFLPRAMSEQSLGYPEVPLSRYATRTPLARGTVLVVDDEISVRNLASDALRQVGLQTRDAGDGIEALRILEDSPDVSAILLDLSMPGMDGTAFLEALRSRGIRVPVVLSSGYRLQDERVRGAADLFHAFLPKPYGPHDLLRSLRDAGHEAERRRARGIP